MAPFSPPAPSAIQSKRKLDLGLRVRTLFSLPAHHTASQTQSLALFQWLSPALCPSSTELFSLLPQGQTPQHLCLISASPLRLPGPRQAPAGPGTSERQISKDIPSFPRHSPSSSSASSHRTGQPMASQLQRSTSLDDCWVLGGMEKFGELGREAQWQKGPLID